MWNRSYYDEHYTINDKTCTTSSTREYCKNEQKKLIYNKFSIRINRVTEISLADRELKRGVGD